jgi:hypothetical protein
MSNRKPTDPRFASSSLACQAQRHSYISLTGISESRRRQLYLTKGPLWPTSNK